jgi:high affinity Mn2+ porin
MNCQRGLRSILLVLFCVVSWTADNRSFAGDLSGAPVAPLPPGAAPQPGRPGPTVAPATQPATDDHSRGLALATTTISFEFPTLSGSLIDRFQYSFHGQATSITQYHGDFRSPYQGPRSLSADHEAETSFTGTLFAGIRLFPGTEIYCDPEVGAGEGLTDGVGLGDLSNGDVTPLADPEASPSVTRLFLRQTFGFGGQPIDVADAANQIAGKVDTNRLVVTVGRFAANDIFDNNTYAHDPRSQFANWGLWENDAWDYPGNTQGYTDGLALEYNRKNYTLRYAIFRPPGAADGGRLDVHWTRAFDQIVEFEQRYTLMNQPGVIRPMGYFNIAHMGDYRDAIDAASGFPTIVPTRSYSHPKYGFGVSAEQQMTPDFGLFARGGWNNGQSESWSFTEVDCTVSGGVSIKGTSWNRPTDVLGIGSVISGLSKDHRDYLAAGGIGFVVGDRQLHYAPEEVLEAYYLIGATKNLFLTFDYQFINHPGYNADRGPVSIGGFRAHVEF